MTTSLHGQNYAPPFKPEFRYLNLLKDIAASNNAEVTDGIYVLIPDTYCRGCVLKQLTSLKQLMKESFISDSLVRLINNSALAKNFSLLAWDDPNHLSSRTTLPIGSLTFVRIEKQNVVQVYVVEGIDQVQINADFFSHPD
ncbi:MAG TPA: hypothetical protein VFV37_09620 [Luteibaculaceae bacterium]|nr:hypothetical protein [Luteibaculaceae bacterium]